MHGDIWSHARAWQVKTQVGNSPVACTMSLMRAKVYVTEPFPRGLPQAPCVCVAVALELVNVFRGEICRIILAQDLDQSVSDPFRHLWPQDGEIRSRLNQRDIPVP